MLWVHKTYLLARRRVRGSTFVVSSDVSPFSRIISAFDFQPTSAWERFSCPSTSPRDNCAVDVLVGKRNQSRSTFNVDNDLSTNFILNCNREVKGKLSSTTQTLYLSIVRTRRVTVQSTIG
uniref:Uncharacterized protein n=1 Tax=Sipha flava TaxID=143950 RepID=A0A2S2QRH1_9HEMI